jgi:hypothetical protein
VKVSPLETHNQYGVLMMEETNDSCPCPIDPMIVTYYILNFISKLCNQARVRIKAHHQSKDSHTWKVLRTFIQSAHVEHKVMLTVGLKTVDTHAMVDVEALLDSGATGLFINHALVHGNGIHTHKLEQPVIMYNINGTINKGGSITEEVTLIMSYQGHKESHI